MLQTVTIWMYDYVCEKTVFDHLFQVLSIKVFLRFILVFDFHQAAEWKRFICRSSSSSDMKTNPRHDFVLEKGDRQNLRRLENETEKKEIS